MSTIGTIELIASIDTSKYKEGATAIASENKRVDDSTASTVSNSNKNWGKMGIAIGAISGVVSTVFNQVTNSISGFVGDAIKRVDTLNAFPRVLQSMGATQSQAQEATERLSKALQGLPTPLQDGASSVQQFVAAGLGANKATDVFLAMNDALLASGGNAQDAGIVMDSLTRALSGGSTNATTMQAALSRMPTALQGLQKATGKSADELYNLYAANPQKLADDLIALDKKGGGGLSSLSDQAKKATSGVGTGIDNMHTAIVRGLASIIQSIGSQNISNAISNFGKAFEGALKAISGTIQFIESHSKIFQTIAIIIGAILTPAIISYTVATTLAGLASLAAGAQMAVAWLLALGPIGIIIIAVTALAGLIIANWSTVKGWLTAFWGWLSSAASAAWNAVMSVFSAVGTWFGNVFMGAWNAVKNAFSSVSSFFSGVWNNIINIFKNVGSAIGNAVGNAFKTAVNGVLGFLESEINGIVTIINGALAAIDKITPGGLPRLPRVSIPRLATGGIVQATPGGILANLGEGGQDEAVIPLNKLDSILNKGSATSDSNSQVHITISLSGIMTRSRSDEREVARSLIQSINEELKAKNQPILGGGSI